MRGCAFFLNFLRGGLGGQMHRQKLNKTTFKNIGMKRMITIGFSYLVSKFNFKEPNNLEEFIISKFEYI